MSSPNRLPDDTVILYSSDLSLDDEALALVGFDFESVSQVIRAERDGRPDVWLARPEGYQSDGHMLRDSETIRLIAFCKDSSVIYATDGCNACRHHLTEPLGQMSDDDLRSFSAQTQVPYAMLIGLAAAV